MKQLHPHLQYTMYTNSQERTMFETISTILCAIITGAVFGGLIFMLVLGSL